MHLVCELSGVFFLRFGAAGLNMQFLDHRHSISQ